MRRKHLEGTSACLAAALAASLAFGSVAADAEVPLEDYKGQWGRAMSTDLDDGVKRLIDDGLVDPARVCMVGTSYGGYAALAAGALSPFDYKCLVAISGISDLPRMLETETELYGRDSTVVAHWRRQLDVEDKSQDAVVPLDQSLRMEKALRRAKKQVELVRPDGEDHSLSGYETRLQALQAVAEFIRDNL